MTQNDLLKTVMRILDRQEKAKQGQGTEVVDDRDDLDYFSVFSEGESFTTMSRRESFLRRHSRALSGLIKGLSICRKLVMNQPAGLDCASASFLAIGYSTTRISVPPVVVSLCPYARNSLSTPQRAISVGPEQLSRSSDPPKPPKRKSMQKLRSGAMPQHSSMFVTPKTSHTGGSRVREPKRGPDAKHLEAELQKAAMATGLDGKELPAWPERPNHLGLREVSTTSGRTGMKVTGLRKRSTVP